ncbi:hypothetical protein LR48_Vigan03g174100 [Vigna angularis]|uniref:Uncharacterized protein n=1 Tax=Phaseolus angularis TaxID=3914 RepID=A0A0L9U7D7_PHAAN|nr:hypothetical protein LR48_Vigan03g174100 [Vigna angularis]
MAATTACLFPAAPFLCHPPSPVGKLYSNRTSIMTTRVATSMERVLVTTADMKRAEEKKENDKLWTNGWKEYLEQSKELIVPDGGPPRWFSPLECAGRLDNSPLLLFLPDLVKIVEVTVRSEYQRSRNRPIYLVGESLGSCLALAVAALNPDIDFVLILANPENDAFSLLTPSTFVVTLGESLRMALDSVVQGLPLQTTAGELVKDFTTFLLSLPEGSIDLATVIKGTSYYRRGKHHDYLSDFILPTPDEVRKVIESFSLYNLVATVMLSTLEDGTVVKGLAGIPSEGPVLFVGDHMLLGSDAIPLWCRLFSERNIIVRAMAHPLFFVRSKKGKLLDISYFDNLRIMGAVPVGPTNLFKLFSSKSHVLLYPGGIREALHRKDEEYKLFWPEQSEFVRMAARFGAKIVPFGVVGEDDVGQVVFDYDDLVKIPYFRSEIESLTEEVPQLRSGFRGEVGNQQVHLPLILPKVPGRFYYYFGKPLETKGREQELQKKENSQEFYLQVKSEVERCIAYLKEKRDMDPYRGLGHRLLYQATNGFQSEIPTFEI